MVWAVQYRKNKRWKRVAGYHDKFIAEDLAKSLRKGHYKYKTRVKKIEAKK